MKNNKKDKTLAEIMREQAKSVAERTELTSYEDSIYKAIVEAIEIKAREGKFTMIYNLMDRTLTDRSIELIANKLKEDGFVVETIKTTFALGNAFHVKPCRLSISWEEEKSEDQEDEKVEI